MNADYYDKTTRDLLNNVSLPTSSGYTTTVKNVGKMGNRGFELLVEGDVFQQKEFSWTLSANLGLNKESDQRVIWRTGYLWFNCGSILC
ncbi:MAG: TonB-dependent receptor [Parabacteroides johnsonii]